MGKNKIMLWIPGLFVMLICSGCVGALVVGGVAAGAGVVAYVRGDLEVTRQEDLTIVYNASYKTLEELEITITHFEKDALSAVLIGYGADNKKIVIKMKRLENDYTKLTIRVGTFGNETMSQIIYDKIRKNL